jgi:hypothetical protein
VISYLEAFQITREQVLAQAAVRTLDYVMRDMTAPEGGFYSAEDADSAPDAARPKEKSEGAFYIWARAEVVELMGEERARWFGWRYGMEPDGNVQNDPHHEFTGRNILFRAHTVEETAHHFGKDPEAVSTTLREAERILFDERAKRPRPHLDDKILTSWNGLMISAFAKAAAILDSSRYAEAAQRAADFLLRTMLQKDGTLLRRYRDGDAAIPGMLDDYAFFAQGLIDLYEATGAFRWLDASLSITRKQRELLEDATGGFYASAHEDAVRLVRLKDDYDGAEPSGNSITFMNLLRLHRITGLAEFDVSARKLLAALQEKAAAAPSAMPQLLAACEFDIAPQKEIVIAGEVSGGMVRMLWENFDPNRVLLYAGEELGFWQPAIAAMKARGGQTTVYVCEGFTCRQPVTREEDLAGLLR